MRHLHLDPLGGVAGDMFIAALLDALPQHEYAVIAAAEQVVDVQCSLLRHRDGVLAGGRFDVRIDLPALPAPSPHPHGPHRHAAGAGGHGHDHAHTPWHEIRALLGAAALPDRVRTHAIGIFAELARAEAKVHGIEPEAVTFHEVGAADSLADIVGAAWLIAAVEPASWSVGPLPLGGGRVQTAHGPMPVPAPATALLLEGMPTTDDGIGGERVTPTGAAILRHLGCAAAAGPVPRRLAQTGIGFGSRELPGISNCLRVLVFEPIDAAAPAAHRELAVVSFEVDDQSPEDLAIGLERLRGLAFVHDVLQMPAFGKKGRMVTHVQLLARPDALEAAAEACFRETTTIGLRTHLVQGRALAREIRETSVGGRRVRLKLVDRPGGRTGKIESNDLLTATDQATRARLRREVEGAADRIAVPKAPG